MLQRKDSDGVFSRPNEPVCSSAASQGENATLCETVPRLYSYFEGMTFNFL